MEFFQTVAGRRYYENHVPRIAKALEKIAEELEKSNESKGLTPRETLEQVASDIEQYEPAIARLLRHYAKER